MTRKIYLHADNVSDPLLFGLPGSEIVKILCGSRSFLFFRMLCSKFLMRSVLYIFSFWSPRVFICLFDNFLAVMWCLKNCRIQIWNRKIRIRIKDLDPQIRNTACRNIDAEIYKTSGHADAGV